MYHLNEKYISHGKKFNKYMLALKILNSISVRLEFTVMCDNR